MIGESLQAVMALVVVLLLLALLMLLLLLLLPLLLLLVMVMGYFVVGVVGVGVSAVGVAVVAVGFFWCCVCGCQVSETFFFSEGSSTPSCLNRWRFCVPLSVLLE